MAELVNLVLFARCLWKMACLTGVIFAPAAWFLIHHFTSKKEKPSCRF
jgi:hypothetical protein